MQLRLMLMTALLVFACKTENGTKDVGQAPDAFEGDAMDMAGDQSLNEEAFDLPAGDTGDSFDVAQDGADGADAEIAEQCQMVTQGVPKPLTPDPKRFALAVFHYNLQYVAGGLKGFKSQEDDPLGIFDYDNDALEDRIIKESFEPLLDILLAHPSFALDIELQGYMLDVLRERHPQVLEKLRKLVELGQVEVISFHYSDQLFVAHSRWSMEQSKALNRIAFERACIPLAKAVFTQEGQFSEGMLELMKEDGQTIGIMKGGTFDYQFDSSVPEDALLYRLRGQDVVVTRGLNKDGVEVQWWFVDDGETALTNKTNPYFGSLFKFDPASAQKMTQDLESLQSQGFFLTTVSDYVRYLKQMGVKAVELEYALDSQWRPDDADNLYAWMGRRGLFGDDEADNKVLTSLEQSRIMLESAWVAYRFASEQGLVLDDGGLWEATRKQVLGEVSDALGWNPWKGEVDYGLAHASEALSFAKDFLKQVRDALSAQVLVVDLENQTVLVLDQPPNPPLTEPAPPPITVDVQADGFDVASTWEKVSGIVASQVDIFRLTIDLQKTASDAHTFVITFPRFEDKLIYSPAMLDEIQEIDLSRLPGFESKVDVPCANGLIGLGQGTYLIKDIRSIHVSVFLPKDKEEVYLKDETLNGDQNYRFVFYLLQGATKEQALDAAKKINVAPKVLVAW